MDMSGVVRAVFRGVAVRMLASWRRLLHGTRLLRFAHPFAAACGWLSHFVRLSLALGWLADGPLVFWKLPHPVMRVIGTFPEDGDRVIGRDKLEFADVRWMEIASVLRRESANGTKPR